MFVCATCGISFKHSRSRRRHSVQFHSAPPAKNFNKPTLVCTICTGENNESSFRKHCEFVCHLKDHHQIEVKSETLIFDSFSLFKKWKTEHEKKNATKFILSRGSEEDITYKSDRPVTLYYDCHRSGNYCTKGKGVRHLKTQGSKKINGHCPAKIKVKCEKNDKCNVEFVSTHVGHKNELAHIFLTPSERSSIANKMAAKVPFDSILDSVKDTVTSPDDLDRIHLLSRKDLHNIKVSFNLSSEAVRYQSDPISVDAWVNEIRDSNDDCILLYKAQGTDMSEYSDLKKNDFMLAIMNDGQASMLEKYGSDSICVDGTHGLNPYDFQLVTLVVIDDMQQGFPCTFLFTNRTDKEALKIFYTKVKERLKSSLTPNVFMSDMTESFYNAWMEVFSVPLIRIYCTWHVDKAWRKNLSKIKLPEKKAEVCKIIRSLLQEKDSETFSIGLEAAVALMIGDPETKDFGTYFHENYAKNPKPWAYCHRLHYGLNTNMHLENLHKRLKHLYLQGKRIKRLDKAIFGLMKFLRDEHLDRIILLHKGKVTSKIQDLQNRHKSSMELKSEIIQDGLTWKVASSSGTKIYTISVLRENCDCQLICTDCHTCIHRYACTCLDSAIKFNMCKHIHLLCQSQYVYSVATNFEVNVEIDEVDDGQLCICTDKDATENEKEDLIKQVWKNNESNETTSIERMRTNIFDRLDLIKQEAANSRSISELEAIHQFLLPFQPTLDAVRAAATLRKPFHKSNPSKKVKLNPQQELAKFSACKKMFPTH